MSIPKNLDEAIIAIEKLLPPDFKDTPEKNLLSAIAFKFKLRKKILKKWKLVEEDNELGDLFAELGIHHCDDMVSIIMTSYWRKMNNVPIDFEGQVNRVLKFYGIEKNKE